MTIYLSERKIKKKNEQSLSLFVIFIYPYMPMPRLIKYFLMSIAGFLIIFILSLFQKFPAPNPGEYYYTEFLRGNYTLITAVLFFISGIGIGYFLDLNPWLSGLSLILVFPITAIIEATLYRGSHNLIPFEFGIHFLYSLPAIAGVYVGKFIPKIFEKNKSPLS